MTDTTIPDPLPELREEAAAAARDWIATADPDLVRLMRCMTHHDRVRWDAPDYVTDEEIGHEEDGEEVDGDGRQIVTDGLEYAEALGSEYRDIFVPEGEPGPHVLAIDVDVAAWLIPSSTGGHGHLYARLPNPVPTEDLFEFLRAAVKIGLVEEGYVNACESRGMTSLRAPWIKKGEEPAYVAHMRRTEAELAAARAAKSPSNLLDFQTGDPF